MNSDIKSQLVKAAEADPLMRDALAGIEWLERRPYEEFPARWHARLNDYSPDRPWQHEAAKRAAEGDAVAQQALDHWRTLLRRTFDEIKDLAWQCGWCDACPPLGKQPRGPYVDVTIEQAIDRAKAQYQLGEQQAAYVQGWNAGRTLCQLMENASKRATLEALLERYKTDATVQ